ncbi:MAG: methionine adenosyltransferase [Anaeromyxobacteraceae bacterium]|nr:methionine adenosyltransferase [Anaeromyxobacteraceae bacterium]
MSHDATDPPSWLFTSESVSEGHPDKVADRISDEVLDEALRWNPRARVAVETLVTRGRCIVAGEVGGVEGLPYEALARRALRDTGYLGWDFDADTVPVEVLVHEQSREIAAAVGADGGVMGAGDQGIMFGYATDETPERLPATLVYSNRIVRRLAELRRGGETRLGPDAKSQVTMRYVDGSPRTVETIVVSQQHAESFAEGVQELAREVITEVVPAGLTSPGCRILVNPSGSFVQGGPAADTGLTGRKIIVDTYGGAAPHGGGAFSGKDPSKVDRSAAYAARWLARNVVGAGAARRCLIQLAYAIGVAAPVSIRVEAFGTSSLPEPAIAEAIERTVDLTPQGIRSALGLDGPIYARTAAYGHFGRAPEADGGFSWEREDLAALHEALRT